MGRIMNVRNKKEEKSNTSNLMLISIKSIQKSFILIENKKKNRLKTFQISMKPTNIVLM